MTFRSSDYKPVINMSSFGNDLCGQPFQVMNGPFLGRCFEQLAVLWLTHVFLATFSSYYMGNRTIFYYRASGFVHIINIRIGITVVLSICPLINVIGSNIKGSEIFMVDYVIALSMSFCWLLHTNYLNNLKSSFTVHIRGPCLILASYFACFIAMVVNLVGMVLRNKLYDKPDSYLGICTISLTIMAHIAYCLTLVPRGENISTSRYESQEAGYVGSLDESVGSRYLSREVRFTMNEGFEAADSGGILSRLFFLWLNPLVQRGSMNKIHNSHDLFELPVTLKAPTLYGKMASLLSLEVISENSSASCSYVSDKKYSSSYQNLNSPDDRNDRNLSLMQSLLKCFGVEYFSIGALKLLSDVLAFSGPLLLNLIVSYLESSEDSKQEYSYFYAFALCLATILGAFVSSHYNYLINRTSLKIRGAVITSLYGKTLGLSKTALDTYSTGQIVNFMSTDCDRIINFCSSFHQFWSLPFQVVIVFCFLYKQVGISFVVGVAFAAIVIPLNQIIAKKIGKFSKLMMEAKDRRIKLMSEILHGIRAIKIHVWENMFMNKVQEYRKEEVLYLKKRKYLDALCVYLWATTPLIIAFLTFTTYVLLGNVLSASKIFTSIALFNMLITPLNAFPWVLNGLVEAWISMQRLQYFFHLPSVDIRTYYTSLCEEHLMVQICNGVFEFTQPKDVEEVNESSAFSSDCTRTDNSSFSLGPLDLEIPVGKVVCIIGKVGSGKSALLSSIVADMVCSSGTIGVYDIQNSKGFGYVPQEAWIQQGSIKENVTFGKKYNEALYEKVIKACALKDDIEAFPYGDSTEVGENGHALSGGQRARIALARALYQDLDFYLIDEPFASVDVEVAEHIFRYAIHDFLKRKTVIICTHHVSYAAKSDYVIVLRDGKIVAQGLPEEVFKDKDYVVRELSKDSEQFHVLAPVEPEISNNVDRSLITHTESRSYGIVKFDVYKSYWKAAGFRLGIIVLVFCFFLQFSRSMSDWWLSYWVSKINDTGTDVNISSIHTHNFSLEQEHDSVNFYLYIYGTLVFLNSVFGLLRAFSFAYGSISAAINIHDQVLESVMQVAIEFFDINPMGRILNRFSSDMYCADDSLPFQFNILLAQLFSLIGCLVITCYGLPWVILLLIPLFCVYYKIQLEYRCTSRELRRISSITLSPLYAQFSETLHGHSVIKSLAAMCRFQRENMMMLDENNIAVFATMAVSQWLNLRLQLIGAVIVTGIAFIALLEHEFSHVDPGLVGLALSYALSLTSLLNGTVTAFTETEKELISVERIMDYVEELKPEPGNDLREPHHLWPETGAITFSHVRLEYVSHRRPALDDITFEVHAGEKVGIVGRTGSGKTSLIGALLRMVTIKQGQIIIDNQDISQVCLRSLRSRLSVIPQDPFLFDGTVRDNMDPYNFASDELIWEALHKCHMYTKVEELGGLDAQVGEKGKKFSVGERQLICLGRALLRRSNILLMDEATSNIDNETDELIQRTVRKAFASTTVIIVAHRIKTVYDCNKIIVMSNGKVSAITDPKDLFDVEEV